MKYIQKQPESEQAKRYADWKAQYGDGVLVELASKKLSQSQAWGKLSGQDKANLRESVLQEQGFLCAYCGCLLENHPEITRIEHLETRDANAGRMFDYDNLIAVCTGGEKESDTQQYRVIPGETWETIARRWGMRKEVLIGLNKGNEDENPAANAVINVRPSPKLHCDSKRGSNPKQIINPIQAHHQGAIAAIGYHYQTLVSPEQFGEMFVYVTDSTHRRLIEDTIQVLGLNAEKLRANRREVLDTAKRILNEVLSSTEPDDFASSVEKMIVGALESPKLAAYCFVEAWYYRITLESL